MKARACIRLAVCGNAKYFQQSKFASNQQRNVQNGKLLTEQHHSAVWVETIIMLKIGCIYENAYDESNFQAGSANKSNSNQQLTTSCAERCMLCLMCHLAAHTDGNVQIQSPGLNRWLQRNVDIKFSKQKINNRKPDRLPHLIFSICNCRITKSRD